jgi:acyl-CoA synthetase (NDP forming)
MPASSSIDDPTARAGLARALFTPSCVALAGASPDPDRLTSRPQRVLHRHGYQGRVVTLHPSLPAICGDPAYPSLRDVPHPVDHAFVMVPPAAAAAVIADCCAMRVPVATLVTAGFGEAGAGGRRRQERLLTTARAAGLRLLGPNCLGVVNVHGHVALSANAVLEHEALRPGGLSVISQSGSMLGAILTRAQERGLGFAKLISVGNECDIAVGELVHLLVDDPDTSTILLFLEAFRDAEVLGRAARRAFEAGKPVIALKLGRSAVGRDLAAAHTGAMTGPEDVARAFFRAHGVICVDVFEALFESVALVQKQGPSPQRRVAALTVSGGAAALVIDRLGLADIEVVPPSPALIKNLAQQRIRIGPGRLIDLPMGRADDGAYCAILSELMASDHCDAVVAIQGSAATYSPDVMKERILAAKLGAKPLAVFVPPRAEMALTILQEGGVAAFRTPEACADALRAYFDWRAPVPPVDSDPQGIAAIQTAVRQCGHGMLNEFDSARVLAAIGLAFAPSQVLHSASDPVEISYPVAAKVLSRDIAHKSAAGAVALDIPDGPSLAVAFSTIVERARTAHPEARIDGVLVQSMQRGIAEVFVGYRRDPDVGPLVVVGPGGIHAENSSGHALRLAPVSMATAREMVDEARGLARLRGGQNRPPGDLRALAHVVQMLSLLALVTEPAVLEAEVNPLIVGTEGLVAVDALVRLAI